MTYMCIDLYNDDFTIVRQIHQHQYSSVIKRLFAFLSQISSKVTNRNRTTTLNQSDCFWD